MIELRLDLNGDAEIPAGVAAIETEADFLRAVQTSSRQLFIRGPALCHWASRLGAARSWETQAVLSPVQELLAACPGLSREQARAVLQQYAPALSVAARPLTLKRLCEAIFPTDLWRQLPSLHHAAQWLLWLDEFRPPSYAQPLLAAWSAGWRASSFGPERIAYDITDFQRATELLATWLGYAPDEQQLPLPTFPTLVPNRLLESASLTWMPKIIQSKGEYFSQLCARNLPLVLLEKAAELTYRFYRQNQQHLIEAAVRRLSDYLSPSQVQELRRVIPPTKPGALPQEPASVFTWFREQYLPYREWAEHVDDATARESAGSSALEFARWYLGYYPRAIATGEDNIGYFRSARMLTRTSDNVTVLVVPDGLHAADGAALIRLICAYQRRLTVAHSGLVFSAVPTVTEICKRAIIRGCPPRDVERQPPNPRAQLIVEGRDAAPILAKATSGDLIIWTLAEPDKSYHGKADAATVRRQAEGALETAAKRICDACLAVPSHLGLRIIITTDHGRLFGDSKRVQAVPSGMTAHQRAAWGRYEELFPPSGFRIDTDAAIVYLSGTRFGVSATDHCAVVLNSSAFHMNDGKTGAEHFAHGGLFPEEVIVPWYELVRDAEPPQIRCKAVGKAREGREGTITLEFINPSPIDLQVISLTLSLGKRPAQEVPLEYALPSLSQRMVSVTLNRWPSQHDALAGRATARFKLPTAGEFLAGVELALETEGFYSRDNDILGDLL
jgi:hypothetical protein